MGRIGFIVTHLDDQDEASQAEAETVEEVVTEVARAIDDMGAVQVSITRQGDEDE